MYEGAEGKYARVCLKTDSQSPGTQRALKAKSADRCKCNVRPVTDHEGPEALDWVGDNGTPRQL